MFWASCIRYTQNISLTQSYLKFTVQTEFQHFPSEIHQQNRSREKERKKAQTFELEILYWIQIEINQHSTEQLNEHRKPVIRLVNDNIRRLNKLSIIVCHTPHTPKYHRKKTYKMPIFFLFFDSKKNTNEP